VAFSAYWFLLKVAWLCGLFAFAADAEAAGGQGIAAIEPPPFSLPWSWRAALAFWQSDVLWDVAEGAVAVAGVACCWANAAMLILAAKRLTKMRRKAFMR
jgi:hypothetical protein